MTNNLQFKGLPSYLYITAIYINQPKDLLIITTRIYSTMMNNLVNMMETALLHKRDHTYSVFGVDNVKILLTIFQGLLFIYL